MQRLRLIIIVLALIGLTACATHQRNDDLTETLNAYATTLRWNGFQKALGFVAPEYRRQHPLSKLQMKRYEQVRIAGYDEGSGPVPTGQSEIRQVVTISLINKHTQRERDIVDHQTWTWDPEAGRWWLISGLPAITRDPAATP